MNKIPRIFVALILNLWPGLGFYFSGTVHNLKLLRYLGIGLAVTFLLLLPITAVITHPEPLINYHFSASDMLIPLTVALISGILGAGVEYYVRNEGVSHG